MATARQQTGPFLEENGLVVVEAESIDLTGTDWVSESSDAGYTGNGYIRWNGADYFGTPGNGIIAIPFKVNTAGNYYVKLRMSHLGAPAGDQWNDTWMKMNENGTFVKAVHPSTYIADGFTFHTTLEPTGGVFEAPLYNIPAGENTVYLSGRSFNLRIDRIHIYKSGTPDPENPNSPESQREDGDGGGGGGGGGVFTLTVNSGTGDGIYPVGTGVNISADPANDGFVFDRWTGSSQYVADPFSPQTTVTMPSTDVTINATYQSSALREPDNPAGAVAGIAYEYYHGLHDFLPNFDTLTPVSSGTASTIDLSTSQQADEFLYRFTGYVDAPLDGTYTFYTASDDGSQLFIGDLLVVDNDSIQSVQERSGEIRLKAGKHAMTVTYFERTGDEALTVSWAGPGITKTPLPASVLFNGGTISPPADFLLGDVSLNGAISALDAAQVLLHVIGQIPLDQTAQAAADVSGNGGISALDASMILQYVVDLIDCFPADSGCSAGKVELDSE